MLPKASICCLFLVVLCLSLRFGQSNSTRFVRVAVKSSLRYRNVTFIQRIVQLFTEQCLGISEARFYIRRIYIYYRVYNLYLL